MRVAKAENVGRREREKEVESREGVYLRYIFTTVFLGYDSENFKSMSRPFLILNISLNA